MRLVLSEAAAAVARQRVQSHTSTGFPTTAGDSATLASSTLASPSRPGSLPSTTNTTAWTCEVGRVSAGTVIKGGSGAPMASACKSWHPHFPVQRPPEPAEGRRTPNIV